MTWPKRCETCGGGAWWLSVAGLKCMTCVEPWWERNARKRAAAEAKAQTGGAR